MRYAKLGLGVLLTIGGAIVTFGGVAGAFFFFHHCVGVASGSLEAAYCHENHVAPVAVTWLVGGLMLDAAAIATIRFRGTPWVAHRHPSRVLAAGKESSASDGFRQTSPSLPRATPGPDYRPGR